MKKIFFTWILPLLAPVGIIVSVLPVAASPVFALLMPVGILFACGALAVSVASSSNSVVQIALTLAVGIGLCFLLSSPTVGLALLCTYVPVGLSVGLALRKKNPVNSALLLSVLLSVVIILACVLVFTYETTGDLDVRKAMDNVTDTLSEDFDKVYEMTDSVYDSEKEAFDIVAFEKLLLSLNESELSDTFLLSLGLSLPYIASSPKAVLSLGKADFLTSLLRNVVMNCVFALPVLVLIGAFLCYFAVKQLLGLNKDPGDLTMLDTFRVDRSTAVLMPVSFVTTMIALLIGDSGVFYTLSYAAEAALSLICAFAGISTICHIMLHVTEKTKKRCRITAAVLAVLCMLTSVVQTVISIIGAYDAFVDIRNRIKKGGKQP